MNIEDKIRKLLALARDNPEEAEAASAAAKAAALMQAHGIEMAQVESSGGERIRVDHEALRAKLDPWRVTLASAVAQAAGGQIVYQNDYRKWTGTLEFYGPLGTVAGMIETYLYLEDQLFRLSSIALAARCGAPGGMRFRRSFLLGAVGRVGMRLAARAPVTESDSQALVVLKSAVDRRVEDDNPSLVARGYTPLIDFEGFDAGSRAGARVALGDTELTGNRELVA